MAVSLLGPLLVDGSGTLSPRDRVVLSALAIRSGDAVSPEQLADALWADQPPASWPKIVQGSVLRLRRALGRDAVQTTSGGYRLALVDDEIDIRRFERLVERGRSLAGRGEPDRAAAVLSDALGLWRGSALSDLEAWPDGRTEASRLDELRRTTEEALVDARLAAGQDVVADATALVATGPTREHRWCLLAVALYRAGRQTDALAALRRARRTLQEELGLDPGQELADLELAILNHDPVLAGPVPAPRRPSDACPYKGLVVYDRADSEWFFGRDDEVAGCLQVLRRSPLLVVAGPSGSGKSSLVRAGVAPALESARHPVTLLTPGTDPASALTAALTGSRHDWVVVVDQLEELFTAGHPGHVVVGFLDRLVQLAAAGVLVVIVVRADQVGGLSASSALARMAERGLHLVAPMTDDELRAAIEAPAHQAGLRLEAGLVELLLREVEGEAGALPLLSHVLAETWARREGSVLTVDGYRASGGIRGAVAQTAELLWESLDAGQRATVRAFLLRLVAVSPDGEPTAVPVPLLVAAADPERERLIELLSRCRLVTTDERSVTVAHEAVIRAWPRLRSWLDEDAAGQRMLRHLTVAAEDWDNRGRPDSELYRGARLAATLEWRSRTEPELTPSEGAFLDASFALARSEQQAERDRARQQARQNRRLRVTLAGTALGLVLALVAGLIALQQSQDNARTARAALVDELVAQSVALRSTRRDLAALLAVEAYRLSPQASTRGALFGVFTAAPGFDGYLPTGSPGAGVPLSDGRLLSDGHTMLAAGTDGVVRVIDIRTGYTGRHFPAPGIPPISALLDVSRDQTTVAEVSWEGPADQGGRATLGVFDVRSRRRVVPDTRLPLDVGAVAVSPDGRYVAVSGYDDGRVLIFDTARRSRLPELPTVGSTAPGVVPLPTAGSAPDFFGVRHTAALAFRPDGRLLVGSEVGVVRLVDPGSGREVRRLAGAPQLTSNNAFALSPTGTALVSTGSAGIVRWDMDSGRPLWVRPEQTEPCVSVAIVGRHVVCGSQLGRVESLDLLTGRSTGASLDPQHGRVSALLATPDGKTLVELSDSQPVLARWRLDGTGPITRLLPVTGTPTGYDASGRLLLTSGPDSVVGMFGDHNPVLRVVDSRTGALVLRDDRLGQDVWTTHPGQLVAWTEEGTGYVVDVRHRRTLVRLQGGFGFPPDGTWLAAGGRRLLGWEAYNGENSDIWEMWDLRTGDILRSTAAYGRAGSTTRSGQLVLLSGNDVLTTYRVSDGRRVRQRGGSLLGAISPTGIVSSSDSDGGLRFLDVRTLQRAGAPLAGTPGPMAQFAFSRDGGLLAARGQDGRVRLVDMPSRTQLGEPIAVAPGSDQRVALRPDGRALAAPSPHGILEWNLRPRHWQAAACRIAGRDLTREEWGTYLSAVGDYRRTCPTP